MSPAADVRLHYFDCRSRGQALRFALVDAGVAFEDARTPIEELEAFRERAAAGGPGPSSGEAETARSNPFGALPVLEWHGHVVAQTLAIATFLASELALDGDSGPRRRSILDMATQAAHLDMQVPYRELLWRRPDLPDAKLLAMAGILRDHLLTKTQQLEVLFAGARPRGPYFGGAAPAMADYFVYESLDRARAVFGAAFESELAKQPAMQGLWRALREQPRIAAYLDAGGVPFNVTASPWETTHRARLPA